MNADFELFPGDDGGLGPEARAALERMAAKAKVLRLNSKMKTKARYKRERRAPFVPVRGAYDPSVD